jgi:hypothetical protein
MNFWAAVYRIWRDEGLIIILVCILFAILAIAGVFSAEAGA